MAKGRKLDVEVTSDLKMNEKINPAKEALTEEQKNPYVFENATGYKNRQTTLFGETATNLSTTQLSKPSTSYIISGRHTAKEYKNNGTSL